VPELATITAELADGSNALARDHGGSGPPILIVHGGMDDGSTWLRVAARLSGQFRVVRLVRRHYRLDLPELSPYSIDAEVEHVLAVAEAIATPAVIVGHSSGGVVALEALVAAPERFAGAVLYEPPIATGQFPPGASDDSYRRAREALEAGQLGKMMQIFVSEIVGMPKYAGWILRPILTASPKMRGLAPRQLSDLDGLEPRLDAYAGIQTPALLLGGDLSPAHLRARLDTLAGTMPHTEMLIMPGRDHNANSRFPGDVARAVAAFAAKVQPEAGTDGGTVAG
jgi:pimeloyl-ACP methyl ester carboxylesterase